MNEVQFTQFQIRPFGDKQDYSGNCMFKGECFNVYDIVHISPVMSYEGINHYKFTVNLICRGFEMALTFDSPTKAEALRWQRELARAYTRTGEFTRKDKVANDALDL